MKAFFSKKRNIIIACVSLLIAVFVVVGIVVSSRNNNNVESTTKPTETTTQSTTESTNENTTESTTETTTTNTENTTKKVVESIKAETTTKQTETTTKKKVEKTNKGNSRPAKTKAELLALTNLTTEDLKYYDSIGLGEYEWGFYFNWSDRPADLEIPCDIFNFVSVDKKYGKVKESYYLYRGKLHYKQTDTEYEEIKNQKYWTDEDFEKNVEVMKTYKCPYCNDRNCCSFKFVAMANGIIYDISGTEKVCPAIKAEKVKCPHGCGRILVEAQDDRWLTEPDKYCDGACHLNFGYAGEGE